MYLVPTNHNKKEIFMASASKAQIKANRENAKRSTGPTSTQGKLKVSQNATTYGIFSTSPLLPSENVQEFEAIKRDITKIYPPIDIVAAGMVERILLAILRQQRLRVAEAAKMQISMTPEIMAEEISDVLRLPWNQRLNTEHISEKQENAYQHWVAVAKEMDGVNLQAPTLNLAQLSIQAPKTYNHLKQDALKDTASYDVFMKTPDKIRASLESTKKYAEDFIQKNSINHTAYGVAQQMKLSKLVPDLSCLALLSKYQLQLDNDLERAIERYKKHVAWRLQALEVEVKDAEVISDEADTEAIAA
jgi:hypothetical protein